jgi:hypothetical protein
MRTRIARLGDAVAAGTADPAAAAAEVVAALRGAAG